MYARVYAAVCEWENNTGNCSPLTYPTLLHPQSRIWVKTWSGYYYLLVCRCGSSLSLHSGLTVGGSLRVLQVISPVITLHACPPTNIPVCLSTFQPHATLSGSVLASLSDCWLMLFLVFLNTRERCFNLFSRVTEDKPVPRFKYRHPHL